MATRKNFIKRTKLVIDCVLKEKRSRDDYTYWSLYLDDTRKNPREIDTCATSLCISLLRFNEEEAKKDFKSNRDTIQSAINTIIKIRRKEGCWPSVVAPRLIFQEEVITEGDVAIGDTCFALNALLDSHFLKADFEYNNLVEKSLDKLEKRIDYVLKTVTWLLENRSVERSIGWYYTNSKDPRKSVPSMYATSNVLQVFERLIYELSLVPLNVVQKSVLCKMKNAYDQAIDFILININSDDGIGKIISNSSSTSYIHTAFLVDVLAARNDEDDIDELEKAVGYLAKNFSTVYSNDGFASQDESFYSEQYPLSLKDGDEIIIRHEHCIEAILIKTFIYILNMSYSPESICSKIRFDKSLMNEIIENLVSSLESNQTKSGAYNGVFRSRVSRPEGIHPVYASLKGYLSMKYYQTIVYGKKISVNEDYNAQLLVKCNALKQLFDEAVKRFGLNNSYAEMTLILQKYSLCLDNYIDELKNGCYSNRADAIKQKIFDFETYYNNVLDGN